MLTALPPVIAAAAGEVGLVGDLVVVLVGAAVAALVMRRLGMAVIPALLVAGMVLGPHALALVPAPGQLDAVAHLAVVILLFGIGLELHLSSLRGSVVRLLGAALGACVVCVLVGWGLAMAFGLDGPRALLVAMALSLSSTALVLKQLAARRELARPTGRLAVAILVVQDLAVIAMLALVPFLARQAGVPLEGGSDAAGMLQILLRLAAVVALVFVSRLVLPVLLRESLRGGGTELLLLLGIAFALGAAWVTHALGFSLEMGAFLAGFVLSGTTFRHELAGQVAPIRDFFLAVFFTTLGMRLDPRVVLAQWEVVLAAAAVVIVAKALLIGGICRLMGVHASVAALAGCLLSQAGEFSLVLLGQATSVGLLSERLGAALIGVVVLTLLVTPAVAALGRRLAMRLATRGSAPVLPTSPLALPYADSDGAEEQGARGVVIGGFGPVGRLAAEALARDGVPYTVIEMNPDTVKALHAAGVAAMLGDIRSEAILREAGLHRARGLIVTVPDDSAAERACVLARRIQPDLTIALRASLASAEAPLRAAGADFVVVDELATADAMTQLVERALEQRAGS